MSTQVLRLTKTIMLIHPCQWTAWLYNYQSTRPLHCPSSTWCFDLWNIQDPSYNYLRWLWAFGFWCLRKVVWRHRDWPLPGHSILWPTLSSNQPTQNVLAVYSCSHNLIPEETRKKNLISVDLSVTRYEDGKSSNKHPCSPPLCGWAIGQHRMYSYCLV